MKWQLLALALVILIGGIYLHTQSILNFGWALGALFLLFFFQNEINRELNRFSQGHGRN